MNEDRLRGKILAEMLKFQIVALRFLAEGSPFGFARYVDQWYVLNAILDHEKEDPFKRVYEFAQDQLKEENEKG